MTVLLRCSSVDRCLLGAGDNFWLAGLDAYGRTVPVDIPGVPNTGGTWDLGAVELVDLIFRNRFDP